MAGKVGLVFYCALQLCAFVLVLVGTPIDQFRSKGHDGLIGDTPCLTLWGYKDKCYSTKYDLRTKEIWALCDDRRTHFLVAEVLSIISIGVFGAAAVFGFIQLCCCSSCCRCVCLLLNILGVGAAGVTWAFMVTEYNIQYDNNACFKLKSLYKYGAGFALFVTGWCLCLVNIVFLMLPC